MSTTTSARPITPWLVLARMRWALIGAPVFAIGWASATVMGEVVGEAWGGDDLHQLGHALGTVLLIALLSLAGWIALRGTVAWAFRAASAAALGSVVGLAAYLPVLRFAPDALSELSIALTLHLPLTAAAVTQAVVLRGHARRPGRWAVACYLAVLTGVAVAWFSGGGIAGVEVDAVHPVLEKAAELWWRIAPQCLLGGICYAAFAAILPLASARRPTQSRP
jgi:hypothetical protein